MNTHIDTHIEDLVDLGAATAETKGPFGVGTDAINQRLQPPGLYED